MSTNAVWELARGLPRQLVKARLLRDGLDGGGREQALVRRLVGRYDLDLAGFLNRAVKEELRALCAVAKIADGTPGAMRQRLWAWGASLERLGVLGAPDARVQPGAILVGGRLRIARGRATTSGTVLPVARAARFPPCSVWPRPVPIAVPTPTITTEPETLESLLAVADALVGVRLGTRGRDKGAFGQRAADLLGLARSSAAAPDWHGEVEVKTLAVVRAAAGWRIKDGPALSMRSVDARRKLHRVLWIIRIDEGDVPGAPVLSWYYQELGPELAHAFERARHLRPKGGAGTSGRGWYLRRDFFVACGLLRSLNGG